jgi:branched-chain amino acid transport system permease protein
MVDRSACVVARLVALLVAGFFLLAPTAAFADDHAEEPAGDPTAEQTPSETDDPDGFDEPEELDDEVVAEGPGFIVSLIDRSSEEEGGTPIAGVTLRAYECPLLVSPGAECPERGDLVGEAVTNSNGRAFIPLETGRYVLVLDEETLGDLVLDERTSPELTNVLRLNAPTGMMFPIGTSEVERTAFSQRFVTNAMSGVKFGLIVALAALGLNLIFGTTGLTNFAHGELVAFGAIVALAFDRLGLPLVAAGVVAVVIAGLFGWGQDRALWRPLRRRGTGVIAMMIISIGFGLFLRYLYQYFIGGNRHPYSQYSDQRRVDYGFVQLAHKEVAIIVIAIVVLTVVCVMLMTTRTGKAMRAVSDNPALASASGMRVDGVISGAFILGTGLAGLAGVLLGLQNQVVFDMGFKLLLLIFAAATLGGLGTIWGALVGSMVVGMVVELAPLFGMPTSIKDVSALAILILILLVRPQGILGRRERIG